MKKDKSRLAGRKIYYGVLGALLVLISCIGAVQVYQHGARKVANSYLKALEQRNYEAAYAVFKPEDQLLLYAKGYILSYLEQQFAYGKLEKATLGRVVDKVKVGSENRITYEVTYTCWGVKQQDTLTVVGKQKEWHVVFPYKGSTIAVYAPASATVTVDGKKVEKDMEGVYRLKGVLPDQYNVKIQYPGGVKPDYIETIQVPDQRVVMSPYEAVKLEIETLAGLEVILQTEKQVATAGKVVFEEVVPGTYPLRIEDPYGVLQPIETQVLVGENTTTVDFKDFSLSEDGRKSVNQYLERFYEIYKTGMVTRDSEDLVRFFAEDASLEKVLEYEDWFIRSKEVVEAKVAIEIGGYTVDEQGNIRIPLLEKVTLTNQERIDGQTEKIDYQVVLSWETVLQRNKNEYTILDRSLQNSLIAYQDTEGMWIQY